MIGGFMIQKTISERLESLSPLSVLARGYSVSFLLPEKKLILNAAKLKPGDEILTRVKAGSFTSKVKEVRSDG